MSVRFSFQGPRQRGHRLRWGRELYSLRVCRQPFCFRLASFFFVAVFPASYRSGGYSSCYRLAFRLSLQLGVTLSCRSSEEGARRSESSAAKREVLLFIVA